MGRCLLCFTCSTNRNRSTNWQTELDLAPRWSKTGRGSRDVRSRQPGQRDSASGGDRDRWLRVQSPRPAAGGDASRQGLGPLRAARRSSLLVRVSAERPGGAAALQPRATRTRWTRRGACCVDFAMIGAHVGGAALTAARSGQGTGRRRLAPSPGWPVPAW